MITALIGLRRTRLRPPDPSTTHTACAGSRGCRTKDTLVLGAEVDACDGWEAAVPHQTLNRNPTRHSFTIRDLGTVTAGE
jgi:hypothetical protein